MPTRRHTNHTHTLLSTPDSRTPEQPIFYDASTTQRKASVCTPCFSRGMAVCFKCTSPCLEERIPPPWLLHCQVCFLVLPLCVYLGKELYVKSRKFLTPAHLSWLGGVGMLFCRCEAALLHLGLLILVSG